MSEHPLATPVLAAGLDVGGTNTALVVTDEHDRLLLHDVVRTNPSDLAGQAIGLARRAGHELESRGLRLAAVGVAVPGRVQPIDGTLALAVNLGAPVLPLAGLLEAATGLPSYIEHDARAAAGWLRDSPSYGGRYLAYLSVGTGISAGVVIDGELLRGVGGLAGELGHTVALPSGPRCSCGLAGCLEAVAAGPAIARQAREALAAGRASSLPSEATSADVFRAAAEGDELAAELADAAAGHLSRAIRALVLLFGVERVIVGGGVAAAGGHLLERLLAKLADERVASALVEAAFATVSVDVLAPETEAGARGAAAIARAGVRGRAARAGDDVLVTQGEGVGSQ